MSIAIKSSLLVGGIGVGGVSIWGGYKWMNSNKESIYSLVTKGGEYYLLSTNSDKDDSVWTAIIGDSNSVAKIKAATGLSEVTNSTLKEWCSKVKDLSSSDSTSLKNYKDFCTKLSTKGKAKKDGVQVIGKDETAEWTKKQNSYTTETSSSQNRLTFKIGTGQGTDKVFENFEAVKTWCGEEVVKMFVEADAHTYTNFKKWCTK